MEEEHVMDHAQAYDLRSRDKKAQQAASYNVRDSW